LLPGKKKKRTEAELFLGLEKKRCEARKEMANKKQRKKKEKKNSSRRHPLLLPKDKRELPRRARGNAEAKEVAHLWNGPFFALKRENQRSYQLLHGETGRDSGPFKKPIANVRCLRKGRSPQRSINSKK